MKRLLFTALLWTVALHAQGRMGAVHSSPAPARSSGPHFSAPAGGYRFSPAMRPAPVTRTTTSRSFTRTVSPAPVTRSFTGITGHRVFVSGNFNGFRHIHHFRTFRPFFFGGFGTGCFNSFGDPFFCNSGFFSPFSYPIFPYDYAPPPPPPAAYAAPADDGQSRELSLEVERLSDEIDRMRDENRRLQDEQGHAEPAEPAGRTSSHPAELVEPPHVLVFKDGRQILADNYAISNNMIWILENGKVKKIPLSDVDLPATRKANSEPDLNLKH